MKKLVKGVLLVVLLAVVLIGGIRFMGHHERVAGHGAYQFGNEQRDQYQSQQAKSFYQSEAKGDYRYSGRGKADYQANEQHGQRGMMHGQRHEYKWAMFGLIPLFGALLLIILGWTLVRKVNARYLKWIGGILLVFMLWPVALVALVIYAGWKLFNKQRKADRYVTETFFVGEDTAALTSNQIQNHVTSADFLDEWEQSAKSKRGQEDAE